METTEAVRQFVEANFRFFVMFCMDNKGKYTKSGEAEQAFYDEYHDEPTGRNKQNDYL